MIYSYDGCCCTTLSSRSGCNNTSVINPIPIVLIVIFCFCVLLFFSVPAYAIANGPVAELTRGSSNLSTIQPRVDRFGVEMLYPTKGSRSRMVFGYGKSYI